MFFSEGSMWMYMLNVVAWLENKIYFFTKKQFFLNKKTKFISLQKKEKDYFYTGIWFWM